MTEIKSRLTDWGKEIRDFCTQHPWVTFNTPTEEQKEFLESMKGQKITEHQIGLHDLLYENRPILKFFKELEGDEMVMMFVGAGKGIYLTVITRLQGEIYVSSDLPPNGRVDFRSTKTFKREFGQYANLWLGPIVAATCVKNLSRQMCIVDSKGEIFRKKAIRHGVSVEKYNNLYPKLQVAYLDGSRVFEAGDEGICPSKLYRVDKVSGCILSGGFIVEPGMKFTSSAIGTIQKAYPNIFLETT